VPPSPTPSRSTAPSSTTTKTASTGLISLTSPFVCHAAGACGVHLTCVVGRVVLCNGPIGWRARGETSFLDWREQTYPMWAKDDLAHIAGSKALSTNVAHYACISLAASLARQHQDQTAATKYEQVPPPTHPTSPRVRFLTHRVAWRVACAVGEVAAPGHR